MPKFRIHPVHIKLGLSGDDVWDFDYDPDCHGKAEKGYFSDDRAWMEEKMQQVFIAFHPGPKSVKNPWFSLSDVKKKFEESIEFIKSLLNNPGSNRAAMNRTIHLHQEITINPRAICKELVKMGLFEEKN